MCGIFAYHGSKDEAGSTILSGLASLEYRGYDSWGIALKKTDGTLYLDKHIGKIGDATDPNVQSHIGIGHTRWATHGGVTTENAHPHTSEDRTVVVVHNGIVENFQELRSNLQQKGYFFSSETDSEVIAHLIADLKKQTPHKPLKEIVLEGFSQLHGMNAIIVFFPEEEQFYTIKNGSPLVYCKTDTASYLASDASALVPYSTEVYYLNDYELLEISNNGATCYDLNRHPKPLSFITLQYDAVAASLGSYPHFMLKEIHEQPKILHQITENQKQQIEQAAELIKKAFGTYLIGCGTAYFACLTGTYLFSKIAKRHINASVGSEFAYVLDFLKPESLVITLSQSGETIDVISSVEQARKKGSDLMTITNVLGSTLYRMADHTMLLNAGPEKAVCSTKAYLAKITLLYLIAHACAGTYDEGVANVTKAVKEINRILKHQKAIHDLAIRIKDQKHMFILGRGVSFPVALESALKIKEVSYMHAEGFAGGELKHGVIALIEKGTPVIVYIPDDETFDDALSSAFEVKARGAYVIGVSAKPNDVFDEYIPVANCAEATTMPNVVIAQLLGYYLAVEKGYDPDKPRNLAKSVTVK